jgi:hypothetical protein
MAGSKVSTEVCQSRSKNFVLKNTNYLPWLSDMDSVELMSVSAGQCRTDGRNAMRNGGGYAWVSPGKALFLSLKRLRPTLLARGFGVSCMGSSIAPWVSLHGLRISVSSGFR